jgi:hypothetical protein
MEGMKHSPTFLAGLLLCACSGGAANRATTADGGDAPASPSGIGVVETTDGGDDGASAASSDDGGGGSTAVGSDAAGGGGGGALPDSSSPPAPTTGIFADAGAYVPTLGPSSRSPKHTGNPNPAGQACLSCHGGQRPNVVRFLFAGTAWTTAAATTPTPMAEVRVVQANGEGLSAYSDADGNFFLAQAALAPLSAPAEAAVRDANGSVAMTNVFNVGDCNSCHRVGGQAPVNLP